MLFKIAFALLMAWLLGALGIYRIDDLVHIIFWSVGCSSCSLRPRLEMPPPPVSDPLSARTNHDAHTFHTVSLVR
jgi:hypothetical protein